LQEQPEIDQGGNLYLAIWLDHQTSA